MARHLGNEIDMLAEHIADAIERNGFWDSPEDPLHMIPKKLNLIHTEVSEATDVHHKSYDDGAEDPLVGMTPMQEEDFVDELADAVIRILDVAGYYDLAIGDAILSKVEKNKDRPFRHGKRY